MNNFPTNPKSITSAWLSEALGTHVDNFEVEPLGAGGGLLGLIARLHLNGKEAPDNLIAKFPTPSPENRAVAETYDMYGREYRFYTQVAPTVPLRSPHCYYAGYNPDSGDIALLLEDLGHMRLGDQVEGCGKREARSVIDGIASLHRNTWQPDHLPEIKQHDMPYQREGMAAGFRAGWPVVIKEFGQFFDDELIRVGSNLPHHLNELLDRIHEGPLVIAHGDVRLDNIFFDDAGIALVDYQAVCKASPEHDLAYFVTQSLSDDVRNSENWHRIYFDELTAQGIHYDYEYSFQRYRLCAMYFLCYSVIIAGTLDQANERGRQLAETLLGNSIRSLRELDALELIS